jgi:nitrite reductase/ring-hydroxylating ferredoxin subunit
MKVIVSRVEDFAPNTRKIVEVGGREIGVFRIGGRFYGVRNRCPHQGGPLCEGRTVPLIVSDEPGLVEERDAMLIMCPWHGWQYDMETGKAYAPNDPKVKAYAVSVESCEHVGEPRDGTFVAETFVVNVEDEYVVLEA